MRAKKYMDGGTVKKSFFEEMEDLGNVGKLSSMGRGMSKAEAAEETGRSQARAALGRAAARGDSEPAPAPAPVPASTQTFGQAFRAARSRGDRTFEWRGRRYTTEMASAPSRRSVQAHVGQEVIPDAAEELRRHREREQRVRAAEQVPRGFAKGGHVKKMASGGTCRGMGKATRGGDYKVR